jgi:hypothetical protein
MKLPSPKLPDIGPVRPQSRMAVNRLLLFLIVSGILLGVGVLLRTMGAEAELASGIFPGQGARYILTDKDGMLVVLPFLTMFTRVLGFYVGIPAVVAGIFGLITTTVGIVVVLLDDLANQGDQRFR